MRFFLIDKITRWGVGTGAENWKSIASSEDFFDDLSLRQCDKRFA